MAREPEVSDATGELNELFEQFDGRLVTQATAAVLLGLSAQTVYTLCGNGTLRLLRGPNWLEGAANPTDEVEATVMWKLVPLIDVALYAKRVGRLTPFLAKMVP